MVDDRIEIPAATETSSSSNLVKSSKTGVQTNIEALLRGELTSTFNHWLDTKNLSNINRQNCIKGFQTLVYNIQQCQAEVEEAQAQKRLEQQKVEAADEEYESSESQLEQQELGFPEDLQLSPIEGPAEDDGQSESDEESSRNQSLVRNQLQITK
jgi:hypothetical protein